MTVMVFKVGWTLLDRKPNEKAWTLAVRKTWDHTVASQAVKSIF
jgi:hypothetical protein